LINTKIYTVALPQISTPIKCLAEGSRIVNLPWKGCLVDG
jgi:hypothetical protein